MAQEIRKVTVAGITGAIGPTVVKALCDAGFEVQALTRRNLTQKPDLGTAKVIHIDYSDRLAVQDALRGQDAVISALGDTAGAVAAQEVLIEASIAVGVKRFVPSEFGSDTFNPRVREFPFFADKLKHQDLLRNAAEEHSDFSYSILITGAFLDWGLSTVPFIVNVGNKGPQRFDGGDVPFSATRVPTLAKALVRLLQREEVTKNKVLYIHDAITTQNKLLACAERLDSKVSFSDEAIDMSGLEKEAWAHYADAAADPMSWVFSFINISIWSREELCAFRVNDNDLLGIEELKGNKLNAMVEHEVAKALSVFAIGSNDNLKDCRAAEKAFEEGKNKLAGFVQSSG